LPKVKNKQSEDQFEKNISFAIWTERNFEGKKCGTYPAEAVTVGGANLKNNRRLPIISW